MDKYKAQSGHGFFDETQDVDDYTFLNHPKQGSTGYMLGGNSPENVQKREQERRQQQLMDELESIQKRTLEASKRSLGLVHESEQIGISTADDLLRQREQLENCEKKVTDINSSLRVSQKHLTSIQSVFAGIKNMFSKTPAETPTTNASKSNYPNDDSENKTKSALGITVENTKSDPNYKPPVHPGLRIRGLDEEDEFEGNFSSRTTQNKSTGNKYQEQLDENLEDLNSGLSRLKGLALGLGSEIDEQNDLIDKVMKGAEKADLGIERQNKQMKKILNK